MESYNRTVEHIAFRDMIKADAESISDRNERWDKRGHNDYTLQIMREPVWKLTGATDYPYRVYKLPLKPENYRLTPGKHINYFAKQSRYLNRELGLHRVNKQQS